MVSAVPSDGANFTPNCWRNWVVVKVDTEASQENAQLAMDYRVQGIPNMKIIAGGEEVAELIGMKPKQALIDALEKAAAK